jgi:hypothetical protein
LWERCSILPDRARANRSCQTEGESRLIETKPSDRRTPHSRGDALPEHLEYRDNGCSVSSSCLSCPLPRCRYDVPGGARALLNLQRDAGIRRLHDDEVAVDEIASRFQVSRRTVFRIVNPRRT